MRLHWSIVNVRHWGLDVAFDEDDSRIRTGHAAHNMVILKRIARNLLRQDRSLRMGIAHKWPAAAWNKDYLCRLIGLEPKPIWMQSPWQPTPSMLPSPTGTRYPLS